MGNIRCINFNLDHIFHVNESQFPQMIETDRLILQKVSGPDKCSFYYFLNKKDNLEKIGEIVLIFDGEIYYKINDKFKNQGYMTEAMQMLLSISKAEHFLSIDRSNHASKKVAKKIGYQKIHKIKGTSSYLYQKKKYKK